MKKALAITVGLMFVAGIALASNTGFKLNYPLQVGPGGTSNANWVSFPYFWFPNGLVGTAQGSFDACTDFNGAPPPAATVVFSITEIDPATDIPNTQFCVTPIPIFDLTPGQGYLLVPQGPAQTIAIVGSHDDNFAANKGGTTSFPLIWNPAPRSNNNLVSIPYHTIANNDQEICTELNGGAGDAIIFSIVRFDTANEVPETHFCAAPFTQFPLTPGEGYSLVPNGGPQTVQFDVY